MELKSIPLDKISCESNRKYTKDEGFKQLQNSIKQYGIIQPPTIRQIDDDQLKVIAGRRRIEAARQLGHTHADCIVKDADDPVDDDEIALIENVNRQEMHPLDEAAGFKRMADAGNPIEEIARYYARSPSAIYKRLRLCGLIEELKVMLRDEKICIAGAALLAELPEEDQRDFFAQYGNKNYAIHANVMRDFIQKKQTYVIKKCMKDCEGCNKRTHNEGNELFEEYQHLEDVCLDSDCYRVKWYEMLEARLQEQMIQLQEAGVQTDNKIYFSGGTPEKLYKKAASVNISYPDGQHQKLEILRDKDYEFISETNRKKNACWRIAEANEGIIVHRIGYNEKPPKEKEVKSRKSVKDYGREAVEAAAADRGIKPDELVIKLEEKKIDSYDINSRVGDLVYKLIIAKQIELVKSGEDTCDYLSLFLLLAEDEMCLSGVSFKQKYFNKEQNQWYQDLIGKKNICQISIGLDDTAQQLFHFLLLSIGLGNIPDIEDLEFIEKTDNVFWKYAGMSKDEYRDLYLEVSKKVIAEALDSKPKKNGKKKDTEKVDAPYGEGGTETAAASSSKQKKGKKQKTGEIIPPEDFENAEEDNYPWERDEEDTAEEDLDIY